MRDQARCHIGREYRADRDRAAGLAGAGVREPGSRLLDSRTGQDRRAQLIGEGVYLRTYPVAFRAWLDRPDVTDILVNQPGEVWIDGANGFERIAAPDVTEVMMLRLAQQIAAHTSQGV